MDRETVKAGMECRWRLRQMKYYGLVVPCIFLLALILSFSFSFKPEYSWELVGEVLGGVLLYCVGIYALVILPFFLYSLYRYLHLLKNYHKYSLHTVVLDKPHTSALYRGAVYFSVSVSDSAGSKIWVDTSPLFSDAIFSSFTLDEYAGKSVRVLCDEEMSKVYLIDKV